MRYLLGLLSCVLLTNTSSADTKVESDRIAEYRFDRAKLIKTVKPQYPRTELSRGIEGWAVFSVIVDKRGNVVEPILIDSSGRRNFEIKARKVVRKFKYQPALLNGEAIESSDNKVYISFAISWDKPGANKGFASRFSAIRDEILSGNLKDAPKKISKLENEHTRNRYEQAWLQILKSSYYDAIDDERNYIKSLEKAVAYNSKNLPTKIYASNLVSLYNAQIKQGKIKDAITTANKAEKMTKEVPELSKVTEHKDNMIATLDSIPLLNTTGSIESEDHQWSHSLLRKTIGLEITSGKLDQIEFRCANKIRRFEINQASQTWQIPEKWEDCTAFISGEIGSEFEVLEKIQEI